MTFDDRVSHAKRLKADGVSGEEIRRLHGAAVADAAFQRPVPGMGDLRGIGRADQGNHRVYERKNPKTETTLGHGPMRTVESVTRSPLNSVRWKLNLSCGHCAWVTQYNSPKRTTAECTFCKGGENEKIGKMLAARAKNRKVSDVPYSKREVV